MDAELDGALVVFNASPEPTHTGGSRRSPDAASRSTSAQANGADPVVKTTTWDAATGTVTVPARSVAVLVDAEPIATTVLAAPDRLVVKSGTSVTVTGRVLAADGSAPVGTVTVSDNGRVIATATLAASDRGRVEIALPKLGRGIHLLRTSFTGAGDYEDSRSFLPLPVLVY